MPLLLLLVPVESQAVVPVLIFLQDPLLSVPFVRLSPEGGMFSPFSSFGFVVASTVIPECSPHFIIVLAVLIIPIFGVPFVRFDEDPPLSTPSVGSVPVY